jgi:hypothetical protein
MTHPATDDAPAIDREGPRSGGAGVAAARRGVDGRLLVVAAVTMYLGTVAVAHALGVDAWRSLGVNPAPTLFYDARNVAAAADCWASGHDPLIDNPCDPGGRVMNYPRIWVLLHFVGVSQDRTLVFGAIVVALFLGSVLLLLGRLSLPEGVIAAVAVASPAVMLAIERANMDLVVFVLFVGAVLASRSRGEVTPLLGPALVLLAAIAKFYAAFALPAFLFTGRRRMTWLVIAAVVVMVAYLVLTFDDVRVVMQAPEGGLLYSFGARILIGDLYHRWSPAEWAHGSLLAQLIAATPVVVLSVLAWRWARRRLPLISAADRASSAVLAFNLGALTYLGAFVTRKSGDYRLVVLLLTLPLLLEWASGDSSIRTTVARAGLIAVVTGLWIGALSPYIGPWDELGSWAVAAMFVPLLATTVPPLSSLVRVRGRDAGAPVEQPAG